MSGLKKFIVGLVVLLGLVTVLIVWYQITYSMDVAKSYEAGISTAQQRVLIATQGSEYKDAVVAGLVAKLEELSIFIRVVDISKLNEIDATEWQAVVLLHTWERFQPPVVVQAFLDRNPQYDSIIALTTSGDGGEKLQGVDAIASASSISEVPIHETELAQRVEALLAEQENSQ